MATDRGLTTQIFAVTQPTPLLPTKRDLLFFDRIGFIALEESLKSLDARTAADIEFLVSNGAVFNATFRASTDGYIAGITLDEMVTAFHDRIVATYLKHLGKDLLDNPESVMPADLEKRISELSMARLIDARAVSEQIVETMRMHLDAVNSEAELDQLAERLDLEATEVTHRILCMNLSMDQQVDVVPLLVRGPYSESKLLPDEGNGVLQLVLNQFPIPDDSVAWEQILEFREDEEATIARRRLRRWINHMTTTQTSGKELIQELEYLLDEYHSHMRLHHMKTNRSVLESVIVGGAEVLENIAKFRFGKLANSIFALREQKVALLEAERSAPGREVAYIAQTRNAFGNG
jgi:hypothetical protein